MEEYEIINLALYSGDHAQIYSIQPKGNSQSLFDDFVDEHITDYNKEVKEVLYTIREIGNITGVRDGFFKHEGDYEFQKRYGKWVYALYDEENSKIRLFCIKLGKVAIVLGGGAPKDKSVVKWQDDERLKFEAERIIKYASDILDRIDRKEIYWSSDMTELEGDLKNYKDDE